MHTFANKQQATHQTVPVKSIRSDRKHFEQNHQVNSVFQLQQVVGNQAFRRSLQSKPDGAQAGVVSALSSFSNIQPKLKITAPGDKYEREADSMADRVMRMPKSEAGRPLAATSSGVGVACKEESGSLCANRRASGVGAGSSSSVAPTSANRGFRGSGQALSSSELSYFEPRFGHNFSNVRVHRDARANSSASALQARAFTVGNDIVFGQGQWAPSTTAGRHLLAHELAHVVQQQKGDVRIARAKGYEGCGDSISEAPWFDGVKATIDHVDPPVNTTRSVAWAGIDNGGEGGMKWLQGGWGKSRGEAAKIYWEYTDKNGRWAKGFSSAPAASETFEVRREGNEAVWRHGGTEYKRVSWDLFDTIEFRRTVYTTEMHAPPGDHTPGRVSNRNDFANCQAKLAGGAYAAASLSTTYDSAAHGNVQGRGRNNFRTWDSRDA